MFDQPFILTLNHLLRQSPWAAQRLQPFAGKTARVQMPPLSASFVIAADGTLASSAFEGEPDVTITLPPGAAISALHDRDAVMRSAQITGDAAFAETLGFVLRNLEWDA